MHAFSACGEYLNGKKEEPTAMVMSVPSREKVNNDETVAARL
jgi:hypothetical protein